MGARSEGANMNKPSVVSQRPSILLVDDSEDDRVIMRRAFRGAGVPTSVFMVGGGEEAIDYLSGTGKYADRNEFPLPALVLLDIKMPGMDGLDVLRWIRLQPNLQTLRVVMLTSSNDPVDARTAYRMGANSFLTKSPDWQRLVEIARSLELYCSQATASPPAPEIQGVPPQEPERRD
jgi:CheY-like chemotaxis protein